VGGLFNDISIFVVLITADVRCATAAIKLSPDPDAVHQEETHKEPP
jgi:hypothetical protein